MTIGIKEFREAEQRIRPTVHPSPLIRSEWLSNELDADVYLKLECLQPGNSFKIRGATNALLSNNKPQQVITASGGNHGLGVAHACKNNGIPCKVVLPTSTSDYRVKLLQDLGAEVELYGDAWDDANSHALKLADSENILYIHPFADKEVIIGQGTIALELSEMEFDALFCSVGGGGLITGITLGLQALGKNVDLYAVETKGAESLHKSLNAGKLEELDAITSIAKTLGAKKTVPFVFNTLKDMLKDSLVVEDRYAVQYILKFLDNEKILVEPATSCILAAAMGIREQLRGKRIVFIICGSNVSLDEVMNWKSEFKV